MIRKIYDKLKVRKRKTQLNLSVKSYNNYEDALDDSKGYEYSDLIDLIAEKTLIYKNKNFLIPELPSRLYLLTNMVMNNLIIRLDKDKINILDFGGQLGKIYFDVRRQLTEDIYLNWKVVETKEMVKKSNQIELPEDLEFYSDVLSIVDQEIDIILISNSLQYVQKPIEMFNQLLDLDSKFIYITHLPLINDDHSRITIQNSKLNHNGPGSIEGIKDQNISYPITFIAYEEFMKTIRSSNYQILEEILEKQQMFYHNGVIIPSYGYILKQ